MEYNYKKTDEKSIENGQFANFLLFKLPTIRFYSGLKKFMDSAHAVRLSRHINFQIFPLPKNLSLVCQSSQNLFSG